jgi:phosphoserine phosphatase
MADLVATFIARPGNGTAIGEVVAQAQKSTGGRVFWLARGEAADLFLTNGASLADRRRIDAGLRPLIAGQPIDLVVQPAEGRRKKLLVADMDSTMIDEECIDELADFVGLKADVAAVTEQAMRGVIAFAPALRARVALLKGLPVATIETILRERIHAASGGPTLLATMRAHGARTVLVSGGFSLFTSRVAAALGFDEERANTLLLDDGTLAGEVAEPILGAEAKVAALREFAARLGLAPNETMAIGDGANDLQMILAAGLGVAMHAKPLVAESAPARLDHADLTGLLYLQGYSSSDFVRAEAAPF